MNLTQLLLAHANDSMWASWLLYGRKDPFGNETQLAEGKYLDTAARVMFLRDAAAVRDVHHETLVLESVPPGINIFSLLNLPVPGNVTDFEGWKIIFSSNSSSYGNISGILEVSQIFLFFYKKKMFYKFSSDISISWKSNHLGGQFYIPL